LLSDLTVLGNLLIESLGMLDLGSHGLTVGGNMSVSANTTVSFAIDVAHPPASPPLVVSGTLSFAAGSTLLIDTSGSSGPPVGGTDAFVQAGTLTGFSGVNIDVDDTVIDAVFQNLNSLYLGFM